MKRKICAILIAITISLNIAGFCTFKSNAVAAGGLTVCGGLLIGMLVNQMMGGMGYDFGDFINDGLNAVCEATDTVNKYWVTGITAGTKSFNDFIKSSFNSYEAQQTATQILNQLNSAISNQNIKIYYDDETKKFSITGNDYCNFIDTAYSALGVNSAYDENGNKYRFISQWSIVNDYVIGNYNTWNLSVPNKANNTNCLIPYVITTDGNLYIFNSCTKLYNSTVYTPNLFNNTYWFGNGSGDVFLNKTGYNQTDWYDLNITTIMFSGTSYTYNINNPYGYNIDNSVTDFTSELDVNLLANPQGFTRFSDISEKIKVNGMLVVPISKKTTFATDYTNANYAISSVDNPVNQTDIEKEMDNLGVLPKYDTVTGNPTKVKDSTITVSDTGEATITVDDTETDIDIDIDLPETSAFWDKFPFCIPFDFYRMITIFVRDEQKPVFTFPIETTITNGGLNYKIDEEIVVDLSVFQLNGIDIVKLVVNAVFYVMFALCLIKITPKMKD